MRNNTLRQVVVVLTVGFCVSNLFPQAKSRPKAPAHRADVGAFVKEIMAVRVDGDDMTLAMWMPCEFFLAAGTAQGQDSASAEKDLAFLKPYMLFVVQVSRDDEEGTSVYSTKEDVEARLSLRLPDGKELRPLAKTPPNVLAVASTMTALMGAEGDAGGKNMHVFVFSAKTPDGKLAFDTTSKAKLALVLKPAKGFKECLLTWRTPFDAMVPATPCRKCKEDVSAKWSFCPWCGHTIAEAKP